VLIATLAAPTRLGHHFNIGLLQAVVLSGIQRWSASAASLVRGAPEAYPTHPVKA
jgi:hypothetical protein